MRIQFLFVFILFALNVFSKDKIAKIIQFNTENEMLMHNSVESVVRDSFGYIWVGTNYGLNRLDGYRTINYINIPGDTNSISNNFIKDLFMDSKGQLWIGTIGGGLNKFNYVNNSFTKFIPTISENSMLGLNVSAITEDQEGNLWIGVIGKGVSKFYPETATFKHFDISLFNPVFQRNSNISNLHCDVNGNIWVGFDFDQNGIYKIDTKTEQITFHGLTKETDDYKEVGPVTGIDELSDGTLLFTIWNGKLFKLNPKYDTHIKLVHDDRFFNNSHLSSIVIDKDENIWISTWENGLYLLDHEFSLINNFKNNGSEILKISSNSINDLYIENENLWVSTRDQGVDLLSLKTKMFHELDISSVSEFKEIDAHCFTTDNKGTIWIGTRGQGLWKYKPKTGELKNFLSKDYPGLINNNILCLSLGKDGILWMGTDGDFIGSFDTITSGFKFLPHREGVWSSVYSIAQTDSFLWCGTWGTGIKKVNRQTGVYTTINFDINNQYNNSIFDLDIVGDDLWAASVGLGLINYNIPKNQIHIFNQDSLFKGDFPKECLNDIFVDSENTLWLSSAGGGLIQYNPETGIVKTIDKSNGISSNVVQAFLIDDANNKWISTNSGITLIQPSDSNYHTFFNHNGLKINHLNKSAILYDKISNLVFVGSPKGINYCSPDKIEMNQFTNPVVFNSVTVNGNEIKDYNLKIIDRSIELADAIYLDHTQKIFTIGFSSMEFTPSFKSKYYYQLEGFNNNWTETKHANNSVQYTNLDPGTYTFKVKASNNDGVFHPTESSIKIVIKPAFWQTFAFKVFFIFVLLLIISSYFYLRYRNLIKNQFKLERLVKERTAEIVQQKEFIEKQNVELEIANQTKDKFFSIIGHDLKNPISIIDQFHELLLLDHQTLTQETTLKYYDILKKTSGQTIMLLDDLIIWARTQTKRLKMVKKPISIESLFRKNFDLCESLAHNKKIELYFDSDSRLMVNADEHAVQTILRNLTTNAIKFSNENSKVEITAKPNDHFVTIYIKDQGIGMSNTILEDLFKKDTINSRSGTSGESGTGLGLIICKEFVALNGGEIWAESEVGKGTMFCFTLEKA